MHGKEEKKKKKRTERVEHLHLHLHSYVVAAILNSSLTISPCSIHPPNDSLCPHENRTGSLEIVIFTSSCRCMMSSTWDCMYVFMWKPSSLVIRLLTCLLMNLHTHTHVHSIACLYVLTSRYSGIPL